MSSHPREQQASGAKVASTPSTPQTSAPPAQRRQKCSLADLSQALFDFVVQLLPTAEELTVKEDVRKLLERLIRTIEPDSRLLSFGSTANGFSLRNSDMDLCCIFDTEEPMSASNLVTLVGDLLVRETKFHVKPLPHARIPIVKLSLDPSPGLPHGIACDIGFENRLAIENTRLLLCYSLIDPTRVRTLVLFLKVWSKRRKVNSPYKGTLSSYGYVLLVIYFLVHVKNPPVLPNLQQIPPLHPTQSDEFTLNGHNTWFFDDIDVLRQRWQSANTESVAELLIEFFRFYAREFNYNSGVVSIRAGLVKKDTKGWQNDNDPRFKDPRERNRFCIEDPFELDYNVARCVTKDGLYTLRGEFMRASRILNLRPERAYLALTELCEERKELDEFTPSGLFIPPRLSFPPQIPYTIGSSSFRPNNAVQRDRLSPPRPDSSISPPTVPTEVPSNEPPVHMAPKRSKWTSPPPEEAPDADRSSYENRLGLGLSLATISTDAREREHAYNSSSSCSEITSDDGETTSDVAPDEDDVRSVRSFAGEPSFAPQFVYSQRGSGFVPYRLSELAPPVYSIPNQFYPRGRALDDSTPTPLHGHRGRKGSRMSTEFSQMLPPVSFPRFGLEKRFNKHDLSRRSLSGTSRQSIANRTSLSPLIPTPHRVPLPPSPVVGSPMQFMPPSPVIVYETSPRSQLAPRPTSIYSAPHSPSLLGHAYPLQSNATSDMSDLPVQLSGSKRMSPPERRPSKLGNFPSSSKPARPMHSHTLSNSTIVAPTTPSATSSFHITRAFSQQSSPSSSPLRTALPPLRPSLQPSLERRPSLSQGTSPIATSSLGTPSPPSSNSSRSGSVGSLSPVSSFSLQTTSSTSPNTSLSTDNSRIDQFERLRRVQESRSLGRSPTLPSLAVSETRPTMLTQCQLEEEVAGRIELLTVNQD